MERFFKLKENGTNVKTEIMAGITTFMTMAYILAVNPSILGDAGMDKGAVFTATALASTIACVLMALLANLPFALSAGMGLNAYLAYTVVMGMGYSWEVALTAVFAEGIIFIVLSLTNVREAIFNAIPTTLKLGVSVGIGLFICFIGLQNAHIVVDGSTLVTVFSFSNSIKSGTFNYEGITVLLALIGMVISAYLIIKEVPGNILIGIVLTWLLGMICQLAGIYVPNPEAGYYSLIPTGIFSAPASLAPTFMKLDFSNIISLNFFSVIAAFLFVDLFDTLGTLIGCAAKADMLDKDGKLPNIRGALLADAVGTTVGACLGTSTVTTFVESSAGIAEGGRTGLPPVPGDPVLCDGSCSHRRRLSDDAAGHQDLLGRSARSHPGLHRHLRHALHVFHLRGNLHGHYLLRAPSCLLQEDQGHVPPHVCTGYSIRAKVCAAMMWESGVL